MERLLALLEEYQDKDPILVAVWFHHRFTQIHPYQDGNGRVVRALTCLILLRGGLLPIVVDRDDRAEYLDALEAADAGDISPLARLFARLEEAVMLRALSLPPDAAAEGDAPALPAALQALRRRMDA